MTPSEQSNSLLEDMSHGPALMFAIDAAVGYTYVDASRDAPTALAGVEISRADGNVVELTTPAEVDALIEALQIVRRELWHS